MAGPVFVPVLALMPWATRVLPAPIVRPISLLPAAVISARPGVLRLLATLAAAPAAAPAPTDPISAPRVRRTAAATVAVATAVTVAAPIATFGAPIVPEPGAVSAVVGRVPGAALQHPSRL